MYKTQKKTTTGEPGAMIDVHPAEVCVSLHWHVSESVKTTHVLKTQKVKLWQRGSSVHSGTAGELRYRCPAVYTHTHTCTHTDTCRVPENAVVGCTSKHYKDKMSLCASVCMCYSK